MNRQQNNKNYAQAAAQPKSHINNSHHQNQQHHHQQSSQQNQTSGNPTSSNFSPSANGKPNKSQTKPQAQHTSTMGNGSTGRSTSIKQKNPVQLPTNGHAWEKAPPMDFGSVNTPNTQLSSSTGPTLRSGGGIPTTLPTKAVPSFGTLSNTTTQNTQAIQASTTVGTTSPGANNNNSNSINNNNNNGVPKSITTRAAMEIPPRTHSAPPQFQDNRNVGQPGHIPNVSRTPNNIHQQQSAVVSHQPPSVSVSNPPLNNHRKDSVSSSVSSNDGQQQPFHPHHSTHHPPNHTNNHRHNNYQQHKSNIHNQYPRPRDKNNNMQHLNSQPVPTQGTIPMAPAMYQLYNHRADYPMPQYYPQYVFPYPHPPYPIHRPPPITQPHIPQTPPANNNYKNTVPAAKQSKAIEIIDPNKGAPINFQPQLQPKTSHKREEAPTTVDKPEESDKENPNSEDKGNNSKAVPIVDPAEKDKEERERKEQERIAKEKEKAEQERKEREEREERERLEKEKKEKEEKERKEREEKERKEREEREERERLEKEKKEKEEKERKEREEKERLEKEKKEREEKERKEREEREERERLEKEKKEKEEKERKEREEKERKEREEKERLEKEKKEREEKERKEREERERLEKVKKEKEEKERKEREEKERLEKEKKEREEKERKEREEKERLEKERLETERKEEEKARKQQEEKEKEEAEKKKKEEDEAKAKAASEDEKKKEAGSGDSKKEEKKFNKGHRPGPLDLSRTTSAPAIPSALGSARIIDDLNLVQYPEGILSPNPALNSNAEPGKFKYDRNFLMQFMGVCKEKPENLPVLEAIGMEEPKDDKKRPTRSGTGSRSSIHKSSPTQFQMGEFKSPLKTSEERFAMSNMRNGASGAGIFSGRPLGRTGSGSTLLPAPGSMPITTSQNPSRSPSSGRVPTRRSNKSHQVQGPNVGQEQVAPLERSENRWVPSPMVDSLPKTNESTIPMEELQRKIKALLNKLTLEKFDSISDQIIDYANKSRDEKDGRILREVIRLIFEKSCDESNFCAMYAQLCRKMMERVDPEIVDENVKNTEGKFVQGGTLFRKYLLNRCQEDFEKGWKANVPVPSNEKGEPDLMSDEYYAAAKAKRQGLGLIRFIGELFKLNMLTERIMHECIKKLLIFQGSPEEEEMESLCKLMNTVGEQLDHVKTNPQEHIKQNQIDHTKAKQLMESYFNRMEEITKLPNLSSRIKFMIMDVIDLRNNSWKPRRDVNAPKTIAEIHEDAAKQKEEAEFLRRTASSGGRLPKMAEQMSRSGSGRREHRDKGMSSHGSSTTNDGWNVVGAPQRNKDKVGDLTKFGSINRSKITTSFSLAPGGLPLSGGAKGWNNEKDGKNIYSVLTAPESSEGRKSETQSSEVQKSSPPTERKKIILAPRTKAIPSEDSQATTKSAPKSNSEAASSVQSMPEELATKKINGMIEEYLSIRDINEVTQCLKEIPAEYHAKAVESFANKVIEQKPKDVENVMKLFKELSPGTCELDAFKNGFKATLEFLMDIGADAPMAYSFTGQLLFSTGLDFRDITKLLKPLDDDKAIEKIVGGYASALKKDDEQKYVQKINEIDFISLFPKKNKDDINKYLEDLVR